MRILFLTSNESLVRGVTSDDGFTIGRISGATIFLLIFTAILGAIAGFLYGLLRMLLRGPKWLVAIAVGVTAAAGGGALVVNSDGIDFRVLDPLWLAVGLFLLLPGMWGVSVVLLTERLLQSENMFPTLSSQIDKRYWGAYGGVVGWLVSTVITTLGFVDLVRDVTRLT